MDMVFNISWNEKSKGHFWAPTPHPTIPPHPISSNSACRPRRNVRALDPEGRLEGNGHQRKKLKNDRTNQKWKLSSIL